jgi:hypothetical protein
MASNNSFSFNQSSTSTASTPAFYPTMGQLFDLFGKKEFVNCLWLYGNATANLLGVLFNILALLVLQDKEFHNISLYDYLRVYTANSAILNLVTTTLFTFNVPHLFTWSNTIQVNQIFVYFVLPVANLTYFFASILDVLISLDRIATFKANVNNMMRLTAHKACLLTFGVCLAIDFPYFFMYTPYGPEFKLNATFVATVWYCSQTAFAASDAGAGIQIALFAVRDVLPSVIVIALNVVSVYLLKQFMARRTKLLNGELAGALVVAAAPFNNTTQKMTTRTDVDATTANIVVGQPVNAVAVLAEQVAKKEKAASSKPDQRLTVMVLIMCVLSILEHISQMMSNTYLYFGSDYLIFQLICFVAWEAIAVKHGVNFWLFFAFNTKFRAICLKYFRRN